MANNGPLAGKEYPCIGDRLGLLSGPAEPIGAERPTGAWNH
jgi:hypothetical protein